MSIARQERMSSLRARQERMSRILESPHDLFRKRSRRLLPSVNCVNRLLADRLRQRLSKALRGSTRSGSAVRDLGCSIEYLKRQLQSMFKPGMSWDNYGHGKGCWTLDHIIPLSIVDLTDRKQFVLVCHYTNLQPLWFEENISKGNRTAVGVLLRPGSIDDFIYQVIGPPPE